MPEAQSQAPNPFAPPRAEVADVADSSGLQYASRWARLGAHILDTIIASLMVYVPFAVILMSTATTAGLRPGMGLWAFLTMSATALLAGLIGMVVWAWITIVFVHRNGQTIAKRLIGIKVVRKDGSRASLARIFWLRNVVNLLFGIVPFYGLIDVLMIFSATRQCIHDRIADTIVIRA
jgi:uncharacterized RDD family membrane protein YckC